MVKMERKEQIWYFFAFNAKQRNPMRGFIPSCQVWSVMLSLPLGVKLYKDRDNMGPVTGAVVKSCELQRRLPQS